MAKNLTCPRSIKRKAGFLGGCILFILQKHFLDGKEGGVKLSTLCEELEENREAIEVALGDLATERFISPPPMGWNEVSSIEPINIALQCSFGTDLFQQTQTTGKLAVKRELDPEGFGVDDQILVAGESYCLRVARGGNEDSEIFLSLVRNTDHHILIANTPFATTTEAWEYGDEFVAGLRENQPEILGWALQLPGIADPALEDGRIIYLSPETWTHWLQAFHEEYEEGNRPWPNGPQNIDEVVANGYLQVGSRLYKSDLQGEDFFTPKEEAPDQQDKALGILVQLFRNDFIASGQTCELAPRSFDALESELRHARWQHEDWKEYLHFEFPAPGVVWIEYFKWEGVDISDVQIKSTVGGIELPGFEESPREERKNGKAKKGKKPEFTVHSETPGAERTETINETEEVSA